MPWAYKLRLGDGKIAADFLLYIDDDRPTGPMEEICWLATRKFACVCHHFGIKDTPRKRSPPSLWPGAWEGAVAHTDDDQVTVTVTQTRWDKTRSIIK
jgi:hypothetical protein